APVFALLAELEKPENFKVIFGPKKGENTSGDRKMKVFRRIGRAIFPGYAAFNETALAKRIKTKVENLRTVYKTLIKRLQATGNGVRQSTVPTSIGDEDGEEVIQLREYIPPSGPNESTSQESRNIWEEITKACPFFPILHRL
ncbi:hypothetical protein K474DRAFT_1571235, partial [Panus rudis PR-1116 ss-1]